jgi:hypothetical protein
MPLLLLLFEKPSTFCCCCPDPEIALANSFRVPLKMCTDRGPLNAAIAQNVLTFCTQWESGRFAAAVKLFDYFCNWGKGA